MRVLMTAAAAALLLTSPAGAGQEGGPVGGPGTVVVSGGSIIEPDHRDRSDRVGTERDRGERDCKGDNHDY